MFLCCFVEFVCGGETAMVCGINDATGVVELSNEQLGSAGTTGYGLSCEVVMSVARYGGICYG